MSSADAKKRKGPPGKGPSGGAKRVRQSDAASKYKGGEAKKWQGGSKPSKGKPSAAFGKPNKGKPNAADGKPNKGSAPAAQQQKGEDRAAIATELNRLTASILRKDKEESKARAAEVEELYSRLKGHFLSYSGRHDLGRDIQTCFRFGTHEMKETALAELEGKMCDLAKDRYGCFMVIAFLRYGDDKQRLKVLNEFRNQMRRLATHNCASSVLDFALSHCDIEVAKTKRGSTKKAKEAAAASSASFVPVRSVLRKLRLELYGREFAVFAQADTKDPKAMLAQLDHKKQLTALAQLEQVATKMAEKGILRYAFAHTVVFNLIQHCEDLIAQSPEATEPVPEAEGAEPARDAPGAKEVAIIQGLIPLVSEACLAMISSADGAAAVCRCIAHADAKQRKKVVRMLKGHVPNLLFHEFGYVVLLALVTVMDDTVLLRKSIMLELAEPAVLGNLVDVTLAQDADSVSEARAVLLAMFAPTSKTYLLQKDAGLVAPAPGTSKKDPEQRGKELTEVFAPTLAQACKGKAAQMMEQARPADLLFETIKATWDEDLIAELVEFVSGKPKDCLEHPAQHRTLKRLVAAEGAAMSAPEGGDGASAPLAEPLFASRLLEVVKPAMGELVAVNRACFVLASLVEHPGTSAAARAALKPHTKAIKAGDSAGAKVLAKVLAASK